MKTVLLCTCVMQCKHYGDRSALGSLRRVVYSTQTAFCSLTKGGGDEVMCQQCTAQFLFHSPHCGSRDEVVTWNLSLQEESSVTCSPCVAHAARIRRLALSGLIAHRSQRVTAAQTLLTACLVSAALCDGKASGPALVSDPCTS